MTQTEQLIDLFKKGITQTISLDDFLSELNEVFPKGRFEWFEEYLDNCTDEIYTELQELKDLLFTFVHSVGGGEGSGVEYEEVLYLNSYNVYIRRNASYYSYHGLDYFQDFYVVTKKQKIIDVYT